MNTVILAVAGGRKTQTIVDACHLSDHKSLVIGYTISSQNELRRRIGEDGVRRNVEVTGWFSFLMQHIIRPYLPKLYSGARLTGLDFDGDPGRYATGQPRFLSPDGRAYKLHIARLAYDVLTASDGSALDRLHYIYDKIYIDEIQDLGGWDLEILKALLQSPVSITMVGDLRQALLATEIRDTKNKQYRGEGLIGWFRKMERKKVLAIEQRPITYRCNQAIADFSDEIFDRALGYGATVSASTESNEHTGIFRVTEADATAYARQFDALCLRTSAASGSHQPLPFINFGVAKGQTAPHVLIYPTGTIRTFLNSRKPLTGKSACGLYVAVTRAQHSVAFVTDRPLQGLTAWSPP